VEKREKALKWLYPDAFDNRHTEITNKRQKDTGDWVLQLPGFQGWIKQDSNSNKLCAYGIRRHQLSLQDYYKLIDLRNTAGAGKTFIRYAFQTQYIRLWLNTWIYLF
jgi:hypothetical protein